MTRTTVNLPTVSTLLAIGGLLVQYYLLKRKGTNMFEVIVQPKQLLEKNPKISYTNGEYISWYRDVVIYRNITSNEICSLIDFIHTFPYYNQRVKLCLVRQIGYDIQLLWTGTIPEQYKMHREAVIIEHKNLYYNLVASQTISEEIYMKRRNN